jgi:L-malate glycosyltransferase
MKKQILIIDNSLDLTGAFKAILINALDLASDFDFHFLIPSNSSNAVLITEVGFKCHKLKMVEISRRPMDLLLYLPFLLFNSLQLALILRKQRIRIIHVNDIYNMLGLLTKCWWKSTVITHVRRMPDSFPINIYNIWVLLHSKFSNVILAVSKANTDAFEQLTNLTVLYDKIPTCEVYAPYEPINHQNVKLLYLANYNQGKGHEYGVKIAKMLVVHDITNFEINFYGGDFGMQKNKDFRAGLEQWVEEESLQQYISFFDKTQDVERVIKEHDIVLNLSDSESFSNVSLEALYYGLPLIATDVGGTSEMFVDYKSGILVPKGDLNRMFSAVKRLIDNFPLRMSLSKESRMYVRKKFNKNNTSFRLRAIYNDA